MKPDLLRRTSIATLMALVALSLAWELWLAPLRPGGSWIALKALPLLAPLRGVVRGRRYTYQWSPLLVLAYATEGIVRGWSETGVSAGLGTGEFLLATAFVVSASPYAWRTGKL